MRESVGGASGDVVLLQNQHPLPGTSQQRSSSQRSDATAHHHTVERSCRVLIIVVIISYSCAIAEAAIRSIIVATLIGSARAWAAEWSEFREMKLVRF